MPSNPSYYSQQEERALVVDLKAGVPEAVKLWFDDLKPPLTRYVGTKVDNHKDRDELVQEVFLHCLAQLPLFRGESSLWTWMCSVANHEIADYYRKKYAKRALKTLPLMDWVAAPGNLWDATQTAQQVRSTLKRMTPRYRELLLGKYLDQRSVRDLAKRLDRTEKAIESDLFRARSEFKVLFAAAE